MVEAKRANNALDVLQAGVGERRGGGVGAEELRRDRIDALVGGLCAQNRRDQQLKGRMEIQLAFHRRNELAQGLILPVHACDARFPAFTGHTAPAILDC